MFNINKTPKILTNLILDNIYKAEKYIRLDEDENYEDIVETDYSKKDFDDFLTKFNYTEETRLRAEAETEYESCNDLKPSPNCLQENTVDFNDVIKNDFKRLFVTYVFKIVNNSNSSSFETFSNGLDLLSLPLNIICQNLIDNDTSIRTKFDKIGSVKSNILKISENKNNDKVIILEEIIKIITDPPNNEENGNPITQSDLINILKKSLLGKKLVG